MKPVSLIRDFPNCGSCETHCHAARRRELIEQLAERLRMLSVERSWWERSLRLLDEWTGPDGLDRRAKLGDQAEVAKKAFARTAFEAASSCCELLQLGLGDWRPSPDEIGTGLEDWQLMMIGEVSGLVEPGEWVKRG